MIQEGDIEEVRGEMEDVAVRPPEMGLEDELTRGVAFIIGR